MKKIGILWMIFMGLFFVGCTQKGFTVQFETNGHGTLVQPLEEVVELPAVLPTLTEEGWKFEGWFWDDNTFQNSAKPNQRINENTIVYAKWVEDIKTYTVTYVTNGHGIAPTNLSEVTALPDQLPVLEETGWSFGGWFMDNGSFQKEASASQILSQNITL